MTCPKGPQALTGELYVRYRTNKLQPKPDPHQLRRRGARGM